MALDRTLFAAALPGYEVGEEIGRGGWGAVYRGRHIALGRDVAIKQLPRVSADDQRALDRFIAEAQIVGQLDHPHVVKVYDFVSHDGMWLIVMEHLGGGTLWDQFNRSGIRTDRACALVLAICAGLEVAHDQGILHRDIKPENIMFTSDGTVRVGDFGIAKVADQATRHTHVGEVVGTPTYMSPEQAMGDDLDAGTDVYSLGIVLYELLAGRLPFPEARSPTQQLIQHVSEQPLPLSETAPDVPGAIADVVMTALEKRTADRFASAQSFGVALARAAGESFGAGWLSASGIVLMGGGRIQAAALRGPTMGAPVREPTLTRPAVRDDHFRPPTDVAPRTMPTPGGAHERLTVAPSALAESAPPPTMSVGPAGSEPPPTGSAVAADPPDAEESGRGSGRGRLVLAAIVLGAVFIGVAMVFALGGGDDEYPVDVAAGQTLADETPTTVAPTTVAPATTTVGVITTTPEETLPPTTAEPKRECPIGERCPFIDSIAAAGDQLTIEWTALGFDPIIAEGQFHVHFFWDIYSPDQAGTNASVFGVSVGQWELTADQPFVSAGEMLVSNRPGAANQICVTVTNPAHAVVNPLLFDCVPIPEGI